LSRSEIEAILQCYVQSAAMPCPYARLPTSYLHLDEGVEDAAVRVELKKALAQFWPDENKSILLIVPRDQPANHVEARKEAYLLRYHLHYLHLEEVIGRSGVESADAQLRAQYSEWIADTPSFVGPRIIVGRADIMMTSFNRLYDKGHPRYAPRSVFTVIRAKDLLAIHEKKPSISLKIAATAKCKMILSSLSNRDGIKLDEMTREYTEWLNALSYYRDFVTTIYTDSYRMDPRTLPNLYENRRVSNECMESGRFKCSLTAFRAIIASNPRVPSLKRILVQNPHVTVFDVAKVVYGDVAGVYVLP
jgi:hypothetical protein